MPSKSHIDRTSAQTEGGNLYIVATPIGHKDDITLRALKILKTVDLIAAEDTRHSGRFLSSHNLKTRLISYHEHNEDARTPVLIKKLLNGLSIALVSNAGTPTLSDPGFRLIKEAIASGIRVIPIPGVSAAITALSAAGLPTDNFRFAGFLSKKRAKRHRQLDALAQYSGTIIIYESPRRVSKLLEEAIAVMGNRPAALAREMTKRHEEFIRGDLSEISDAIRQRSEIKGECVLIISGHKTNTAVSMAQIRNKITDQLNDGRKSISDLAKVLAREHGLSKNKIYKEALEIQKQIQHDIKNA